MTPHPGITATGSLWQRLKGHWVTAAPAPACLPDPDDGGCAARRERRAIGWTGLGTDRLPPQGASDIWERRP